MTTVPFKHGVVYTKPAEVSLEEMTLDNVVITDVPTPALLRGSSTRTTTRRSASSRRGW